MELSLCGMKLGLFTILLSLPSCFGVPAAHVILSRTDASQVLLNRHRRANSFVEELKLADLERECLEEKCSYEEAREIFSIPDQLDAFWRVYTEVDHCKSEPCQNGATCDTQTNTYICICPPMFEGRNCDKEILNSYGCLYKNGGCEHFCTEAEDLTSSCHCAPGYSLSTDNSSCVPQVKFPCGRTDVTNVGPRIVKGHICPKGECPWQALLEYEGQYKCGGIILDYQWILTAAHCVWKQHPSKLQVSVGKHNRNVKEATEQLRKVSKVLIHPQYNFTTSDSDLALLRLRRNISLNSYVIPICLPPAQGTFDRTLKTVRTSTVSGWGRLSQFGPPSLMLQRLEVPLVPLVSCQAHSGLRVTNNMLCAGYREGGRDACQGDSGGPLVTKYNTTWFLTGIVSWGKGCARANMYGIYTRVAVFVEWITNNMAKE